MKNDKYYRELVLKMHEVSVVPPQTVGPLTPLYRLLVPQLKYFPFKALVVLSFLFVFLAYLVFGAWLVRLAELLQKSF